VRQHFHNKGQKCNKHLFVAVTSKNVPSQFGPNVFRSPSRLSALENRWDQFSRGVWCVAMYDRDLLYKL